MKESVRFGVLGVLAVAVGAGCPFSSSGIGNGFSNTGGGSTSTSTSDTTSSTPSSTSSSSTTSGTGGGPVCSPGQTQSCFDGPMGEADAGICKAGTATCLSNHMWGPCAGEVAPPQVDNCASGIGQDCMPATCSGAPVTAFGRTLGGNKNDVPTAVAVDSMGNTIVVGKITGSGGMDIDFGGQKVTPNGNEYDFFVAKYDKGGMLVWVKDFGAAGSDDVANGVAVAPDDTIVVVGSYEKSFMLGSKMLPMAHGIFVAKLDESGGVVWANGYPGDGATRTANAVAIAKDGHIAVVGSTAGMATIGATTFMNAMNDTDGFLLYLDAGGTPVWLRAVRDSSGAYQELNGVAIDSKGNVLVTGQATGDADFSDGPDMNHQGMANIAIAKYSPTGNVLYKFLFGDAFDGQIGRAVAVDAHDSVYVTGEFAGTVQFDTVHILTTLANNDFFLVKLDDTGAVQWAKALTNGISQHAAAFTVAADPYSVTVAGEFDGTQYLGTDNLTSAGGLDVFVAKLGAADGGKIWLQKLGGSGDDHPRGVAVDPHGAVTVVGSFDGNIDVGGGTVATSGQADIFIARYAP